MGMFLPEDLGHRIIHFIKGRMQFPFIRGEELMGIFFIFGRNHGLYNHNDVLVANDLARRTVASLTNAALNYHNSAAAHDSSFIRHNYTKRIMQLSLELANEPSFAYLSQAQRNRRIAGDPSILTDCYAQHIAYFQQDQIFEVFQPLKDEDLPLSLRGKLQRRMILLGYNVKNKYSLPSSNTLVPFLAWLAKVEI
jgi:hypothetical protein